MKTDNYHVEDDIKQEYNSKVQTSTTSAIDYDYTSQNSYSTESLLNASPAISPEIEEKHSDHQNQLKPNRDASRGKLLNDKNLTELNNSEDEKTSIASQYDQKMKNIYKSDKMPISAENEKRFKRGVKFSRKGKRCYLEIVHMYIK